MNANQQKIKMADYSHIIDDGDSNGHGYILPKQNAKSFKSVFNCGIAIVDVSAEKLLKDLVELSNHQQQLLANIT